MKKSILQTAGRLAAALGIVAICSAASVAESRVYVRMGDGRVVYTTRDHWHRYYHGGVVVNALPSGYVNEAYTYSNGYPVYYQQTYWTSHHRHWHGHGGHGHGHGHGHH